MLTEAIVKGLSVPDGQAQLRVKDPKHRGLYLVVGKKTKTWMLKRKNVWTRVGGWPQLGIKAARERTLQLLAAGDTNRPMGLTLTAAYELWKKARRRAASTLRGHKEYLNLHFEDWKDTDLSDLSREEVQRRHEKISSERGPKAANNGMKALRSWWSAAQKIDPALPVAPTIAVNWHEQQPVDESALLARLHEWNTLLDTAVSNPVRRAMIRFMLMTGLRSGDVKGMRWEHVGQDTLFLPKPKGGERKAFTLPLVAAHLELLEIVRPYAHRARVFPLFNARISPGERKRFGALRWSPHSMRRIFISVAVEAGLTPYEIALLVNHKVPGITFGYVAKAADMRPQMERVVARLQSRFSGA